MRTGKYLLGSLIIFLLGTIGGVWAQAFLLPYLATHAPFQSWESIQQWGSRTLVLETVEQITIGEREGVARAAQQVHNVVVGIESNRAGQLVRGSGFIYTSEGLVVTLASLVPQGYAVSVYTQDAAEPVRATVLKRDPQRNFALVKIEGDHFPTTSFARAEALKAGTGVFVLGKFVEAETNSLITAVNDGIIRSVHPGGYRTSITESTALLGAPLFDFQGRIIGVSGIDGQGIVQTSPLSSLRAFLETE